MQIVQAHPRDPLAAGAALRRELPDLDPALTASVLDQAHLRRLASARYGLQADDLLLTRDGLEQATRPEVAARRARLFRAAGATRVLDLTGGLGFDTRAFVAEGLEVTALESDAATAALLRHNAVGATVIHADATADGTLAALLLGLSPDDVVFVDPARRDPAGPRDLASARARAERDPARWSPPWPFVENIAHPRIAAKVAPAFRPPRHWHAEWVSVHRTVVECSLYSWPAFAEPGRAVLLCDGQEFVLPADDAAVPVAAAVLGWLSEPDPAIVRAHAVGALVTRNPGLAAVDPLSGWLTSDVLPAQELGLRSYRLVADISGSVKGQRALLAAHGVRSLTVKSRDVDVEPRTVLRSLGVPEGVGHVLVMTRRAGRALTLLVEPAARLSG